MESFENIVKILLEQEGYWVLQSYKIELSKEEKERLGKKTIPRPEIDMIAYKPSENKIIAIEVKSYFDNRGFNPAELEVKHEVTKGSFKLFTCEKYRVVVLARLKEQLENKGLITGDTEVFLGLVAGNINASDERIEEIREKFSEEGYFFWSPTDVKEKLKKLSDTKYTNDPVVIAAKILLREKKTKHRPGK